MTIGPDEEPIQPPAPAPKPQVPEEPAPPMKDPPKPMPPQRDPDPHSPPYIDPPVHPDPNEPRPDKIDDPVTVRGAASSARHRQPRRRWRCLGCSPNARARRTRARFAVRNLP